MEKDFNKEIKMLDEIYLELVEAIMNKPESQDYEKSKIYFENAAARMNKWANVVKDVKNQLESRNAARDLTAENRPA
ncbi:MAG: hypothetical protein HND52_08950 [Ignavibacteriae bacterium]|nr:hypothetical protein [Ignavibacteriota bacterium]NOG98077.1 hypothetical protein [Ignavibacteriota bacterium]